MKSSLCSYYLDLESCSVVTITYLFYQSNLHTGHVLGYIHIDYPGVLSCGASLGRIWLVNIVKKKKISLLDLQKGGHIVFLL